MLRSARLGAGRSQAEVAEAAGVAQPVVSAYERSRRVPTLPQLERLARAAGGGLRVRVTTALGEPLLVERAATLVDLLLLADAYAPGPVRDLNFPPLAQ